MQTELSIANKQVLSLVFQQGLARAPHSSLPNTCQNIPPTLHPPLFFSSRPLVSSSQNVHPSLSPSLPSSPYIPQPLIIKYKNTTGHAALKSIAANTLPNPTLLPPCGPPHLSQRRTVDQIIAMAYAEPSHKKARIFSFTASGAEMTSLEVSTTILEERFCPIFAVRGLFEEGDFSGEAG